MTNIFKKSMMYLGLSQEDLGDIDQETQVQPRVKAEKPAKQEETVHIAPVRKLTPVPQPAAAGIGEIFTIHPTAYADARLIAETFREEVPVVLDLSRVGDAEAKRIVDFCSGLVLGLNGHIERITGKVFVLRPFNVAATSEEDYTEEPETAERPLLASGI